MLQENVDLNGDLIGVTLRGVPKDDGDFLLFLHEPNESGGEYAILLGDLDLNLDLARSSYGSCLEVEASGIEVTPGLKLILECIASGLKLILFLFF